MTEDHINLIARCSVPKTLTLEEVEAATNADRTLKGVRAAIKLNKWHYDDVVKPFKAVKDELTVTNKGVILRGYRIVLPESLQQRAIDVAHASHLGLSKTKALIREKVWFPRMDDMIKKTIDKCIACQAVSRSNPREPTTSTEMPNGPWEKLHMDFYGPLPSGDYLLVVIDRYSRFPEVEIVRSTKASIVIPKLDKIFAVHGIPHVIKTDNGPPFNGEEYRDYAKALGIKLEFSTPLWPQGNAEAERFMQPLAKAIKTSTIEQRPWKQELNRFLLQYRTTPHCSTGVPPAELIFNRTVHGYLPEWKKKNNVNRHKEAQQNEKKRKEYNEKYDSRTHYSKKSEIKIGDHVLVQQERKNKLTPTFNPTPYIVTKRQYSRVTARSENGHIMTRNVSYFKRISKPTPAESDDDDEGHHSEAKKTNGNGNNTDQADVPRDVRRSSRVRGRPNRFGQSVYD